MKTEMLVLSRSRSHLNWLQSTPSTTSNRRRRRALALVFRILWLSVVLLGGFNTLAQPVTLTIDYSLTNGAIIGLQGAPGQHAIQYASNLYTVQWTTLDSVTLTDTNRHEYTDTGARTVSQRYYRTVEEGGTQQVYSANVVGFVNHTLPTGFGLFANPLVKSNANIGSLFPTMADGVLVWKPAGNAWDLNWYAHDLGWGNGSMRLDLGEPFWIYNPGPADITLTFQGDVPTGSGFSGIGTGVSLCNFLGPVDWSVLPIESVVYVWNRARSVFDMYEMYDIGWDPVTPTLDRGEAFYLWSPTSVPRGCWNCAPLRALPVTSPPGVTLSTLNATTGSGRVMDQCGAPLTGCRLQAQVYSGSSASESEMLTSSTAGCFLTGAWAGMLTPTLVSIPSAPSAEISFVQLRVWETNGGVSYETAVTNASARTGKSEFLQVRRPSSYVIDTPILAPVFNNFSVSASIVPAEVDTCAVIKLCGPVGTQYRVDWADVLSTNNWSVLTNVTLPYSPFVIIDTESTHARQRFYRTVQVP